MKLNCSLNLLLDAIPCGADTWEEVGEGLVCEGKSQDDIPYGRRWGKVWCVKVSHWMIFPMGGGGRRTDV